MPEPSLKPTNRPELTLKRAGLAPETSLAEILEEDLFDPEFGLRGLQEIVPAGVALGIGRFFNSIAQRQHFLLTLTSVCFDEGTRLLESETPEDTLKELASSRVFQGTKILNLCSGYNPSFAVCANAFGAKCITVDYFPLDNLYKRLYEQLNGLSHITGDLRETSTWDRIQKLAGSEKFSLVMTDFTNHPTVPSVAPPRDIVTKCLNLLSDNGAYFQTEGDDLINLQKAVQIRHPAG